MEKDILLEYILGGVTLEFLIAFYLFALLGVVLSMLLHYKEKELRAKKNRKKVNFSVLFWLKDNIIRLFTSIICIFVLVRFYDELPINYELNMFLGIVTGTSLDRVIIFIRNRTKIDIFQQKK